MKTPLCAVCGCELARSRGNKGLTSTIDHQRSPHRPRVGWCEEHWDDMTTFLQDRRPLAEQLAEIDARGPGRVVRRVAA